MDGPAAQQPLLIMSVFVKCLFHPTCGGAAAGPLPDNDTKKFEMVTQ